MWLFFDVCVKLTSEFLVLTGDAIFKLVIL